MLTCDSHQSASKQARKASSEHLRSAGRPKSWNYQIQSNLVVSWQEQRRSESNYLGTGFGAVGHTVAAIPQRKSVD